MLVFLILKTPYLTDVSYIREHFNTIALPTNKKGRKNGHLHPFIFVYFFPLR